MIGEIDAGMIFMVVESKGKYLPSDKFDFTVIVVTTALGTPITSS